MAQASVPASNYTPLQRHNATEGSQIAMAYIVTDEAAPPKKKPKKGGKHGKKSNRTYQSKNV